MFIFHHRSPTFNILYCILSILMLPYIHHNIIIARYFFTLAYLIVYINYVLFFYTLFYHVLLTAQNRDAFFDTIYSFKYSNYPLLLNMQFYFLHDIHKRKHSYTFLFLDSDQQVSNNHLQLLEVQYK